MFVFAAACYYFRAASLCGN